MQHSVHQRRLLSTLKSLPAVQYNPSTRRVHTPKDVTYEETRSIAADSPLARRHVGEGENSVLFPDAAAANQQQLHVNGSSQPLDHEPPANAAEDIDDELVGAGLAGYSDHELGQSESEFEDNDAHDARSDPVLPQGAGVVLTTATTRWISCRRARWHGGMAM